MSVQHSTSPDLWRAVWRLADAWSETPLVKDFAATLPRNQGFENRGDSATGIPALLQHLDMHAGMMMKPLMFGSRVPVLLDQPLISGGTPAVDQSEIAAWLTMANQIETAHRMTLAWLRSRLAGYPILRAPQLAPGTPLTTFEMTIHYGWAKEEFSAGLNQLPAPPSVPNLLGAHVNASRELDEAARDLVRTLEVSPAWIRFHDSLDGLGEVGKVALRDARRELAERLSLEAVDDHEENFALPRAEYRAHTTAEVIDSLTDSARKYADAFNDVHKLLTLVACEIFGELALFGEPWPLPVLKLATPQPGQPIVAFEGQGAAGLFLDPGQVLWLSNESVPDAVRIETKSMKFDVEGLRQHFQARVLIGTGEGWPASTIQIQADAAE
ncbi:hypothetical protein SAMN04488570_0275 [Nocardioides scoriae]|uniref:Uncharacterized protein n=1 Tax=Nocardioides scoriae TaxID=642780 RepID=A0A1H1LN50_9ACTN|nr:hypothetical protein [Nocardioides scoriae]SDR75505.1 hypothetical protein SAMN04488570_0275 [Nocardioides scoriae]